MGESPAWDIDATKTYEWNVSVQKGLPFNSAVTVSYVGSRLRDQVSLFPFNEVPPGNYPDLQAAKPYPAFGEINVLENRGTAKYNGLQIKWERRFAHGLSFSGSYALRRRTPPTPWRGRDRPHPAVHARRIPERARADRPAAHGLDQRRLRAAISGRDRRFLNTLHPVLEVLLGGWQLSGINSFVSGAPLSINVPGATLGNGWGTRANLTGDPGAANPSVTSASTRPRSRRRALRSGNSALGVIEGPGTHILDLGLMKSFSIGATRYIQVRAEAYNALNHVNLGNPGTTLGTSNFGRILSAGAARTMQFGLKLAF